MPLKVGIGGAEKLAAKADVYIGAAKKRVTRIDAWNGSAWKVVQSFAPPMSLSVTPNVSGAGNSFGTVTVTSGVATATPTGGTGPYTYAWTKVAGDTLTVASPNSASTTFRAGIGPSDSRSATYRCTVTDKTGLTASGNVSIYLVNTSGA